MQQGLSIIKDIKESHHSLSDLQKTIETARLLSSQIPVKKSKTEIKAYEAFVKKFDNSTFKASTVAKKVKKVKSKHRNCYKNEKRN